jgi:uncharacterized protein (DUF1697 family)
MERLRALFESLGFSGVETFIASGNVIFDSTLKSDRALERKIEEHLHKSLGYEVATFVRTLEELADVARFPEAGEGATLYIGFLREMPVGELRERLALLEDEVNSFHFAGRELYWICRGRMLDSKVSGGLIEKTLKAPVTMRNVNTVRKLVDKYSI